MGSVLETALRRATDAGACFRRRPVVTLCPYIVGTLDREERVARVATLREIHDEVLTTA
jgi:hypothetical protein